MLRSELSDIEARRQDYMVAFVQAKARLAEAEGAGTRLASEHAASLATAIGSADRELAVAREAMISAGSLASALYRPSSRAQDAESYEIVRQSKDGATTQVAMETSPLMPGDVLKINLKVATAKPVSIAPLPSPELQLPDVQAADKSLISWPAEAVGGARQRPASLVTNAPVSIGDRAGCKPRLSLTHSRLPHRSHGKLARNDS